MRRRRCLRSHIWHRHVRLMLQLLRRHDANGQRGRGTKLCWWNVVLRMRQWKRITQCASHMSERSRLKRVQHGRSLSRRWMWLHIEHFVLSWQVHMREITRQSVRVKNTVPGWTPHSWLSKRQMHCTATEVTCIEKGADGSWYKGPELNTELKEESGTCPLTSSLDTGGEISFCYSAPLFKLCSGT